MSALYNSKNVFHVFVCADAALSAKGTLVTKASDLNTGEVAFLDLDNKCVVQATTALAAGQTFRVVHSDGTTLHYSPWINVDNVVSTSYKAYAAAVQQVSYIGYAGSGTGNIEAIDLNEYIVRVLIQGTETTFGNKQMYKFGAYKSGNTAYSSDIATNLAGNLTYNFKREPQQLIKFEAICDNAGVANAVTAGGDWTHLYFLNGSTTVLATNSAGLPMLGSDELIDTIVAGDYLRAGTAVTDPMYKIASVVNGTGSDSTGTCLKIILEQPYAGATALIAAASTEYVTNALANVANWGIKCTGLAWDNFRAGVFGYGVTRFKLEPQNCGNTAVTYTTAAYEGVGVRAQVQELEWFAQGNLGNKWRIQVPPAVMYDNTTAVTYNMITLKYYDKQGTSVLDAAPPSYGEIVFAVDDVSDTSGQNVYNTVNALKAF